MKDNKEIPLIVREVSLAGIRRVDAALEGKWNPTVVTVWSRDQGLLGFSKVVRAHSSFKPSLEIHFSDAWLGIHCFKKINGENVFDEKFAAELIRYVELKCKTQPVHRKK